MMSGVFMGVHVPAPQKNMLKTLSPGTILQWVNGYTGTTQSSTLKAGSYTKIVELTPSINDGMSYKLILCTKTGKEYTKTLFWNIDQIQAFIDKGDICVI